MQKNIKELLPVGSVVILKDAIKKIAIIGILQEELNNEEEIVWDYIGVLYPEGFLGTEGLLLFNHDQIETVFFNGYVDEEYDEFKSNLEEFITKEEKEA